MREARDSETGATYYYITEAEVSRTVSVTDVIAVDLDEAGELVGVELAVPVGEIDRPERAELYDRFPQVRDPMGHAAGSTFRQNNPRAAIWVGRDGSRHDRPVRRRCRPTHNPSLTARRSITANL